jgi:hypothetical protein
MLINLGTTDETEDPLMQLLEQHFGDPNSHDSIDAMLAQLAEVDQLEQLGPGFQAPAGPDMDNRPDSEELDMFGDGPDLGPDWDLAVENDRELAGTSKAAAAAAAAAAGAAVGPTAAAAAAAKQEL